MSVISVVIGTKFSIAVCAARTRTSTAHGIIRRNTKCSHVIYDKNSKALSRIVAKLVRTGLRVPVKCVPTKDAGSFTGSLKVPGRVLGTTRHTIKRGEFPYSVKSFGSSAFICVTTFNLFARISCGASRRLGGVFKRITCVVRNIGRLQSVPSFHVRIRCSKGIFRSRFVCKVIAGSISIKNFGKVAKGSMGLSSNLFRIALVHGPGGPVRLGRVLTYLAGVVSSSSLVCSFGASTMRVATGRRMP